MRSLALVLLMACAAPKPVAEAQAPSSPPAAVTSTFTLTEADLEAFIQKHPKLAREYYDLRRGALEEMLAERLVLEAAKKLGVSEDTWLADAVEKKVVPPSEAEMKAFFEQRIAPENPAADYASEKPRIKEFLLENRHHEAMGKVLADLRADAHAQLKLPPARVPVSTSGPARGPANAPLTLVEFSDYQCPYCQREEKALRDLLAAYPTQVRLVVRDFPLDMHPFARGAARAAVCADAQGRFWDMHDRLFADTSALDPEGIATSAKALKLDGKKFEACLKAPETDKKIRDSQREAEEAGVDGTPALFLNGRPFAGAVSFGDLKTVVDEELADLAAKK